jgi:ubiquitin C-terminal hydrolase
LNNKVRVSEELNLSRLITLSKHHSTKNPFYELVGVVNHSGGINFGHYTADCKNAINGKWYNFNDSNVSETRMSSTF